MLRTKSIYSPIEPLRDGLRVLITRYRGRGLEKSRYHVWMANLGPSERLLKEFKDGKASWPEFARRYERELFEVGGVDLRNRTIKNYGQKFTLRFLKELAKRQTVTLMCVCDEEEMHCHRHVLQKLLLSNKI